MKLRGCLVFFFFCQFFLFFEIKQLKYVWLDYFKTILKIFIFFKKKKLFFLLLLKKKCVSKKQALGTRREKHE